jgi:ribosomal protein L11 methyltransferase
MHLELSFELGACDPAAAEAAAEACGACAVTFLDAGDDSALEPAAGELRLWSVTRVKCLFEQPGDIGRLTQRLARTLGIDAALIGAQQLPERAWEREWLKDFHALRFGRRLWVCPRHEQVSQSDAVVVTLDPGLAFGTGTHPSTALCLEWLDAQLLPGGQVIDYGCGSGVLAIAAARLGAAAVHAFDIDPQALLATRENACANAVDCVRVHAAASALPADADVLLANILCGTLCELAPRFAALVRPRGTAVLSGLMRHELAEVTDAYRACFDVSPCGARDDWVCLAARRRAQLP